MSFHDQQAKGNLASQFSESSGFIKWLSQKMLSYDNAQEWVNYVQENLDLDVAEGFWLDLIGLIVGQGPRGSRGHRSPILRFCWPN